VDVTANYPMVKCRPKSSGAVSNAGMLQQTETARVLGLVEALAVELDGFTRPRAVHLPGKVICDLAVMLAAGGDCPADVVMLRARPHLFGKVASDPTTAIAGSRRPVRMPGPRRMTSVASVSIRPWRSPTTAPVGPVHRWPGSCARAMPGPTPRPTTSPSPS